MRVDHALSFAITAYLTIFSGELPTQVSSASKGAAAGWRPLLTEEFVKKLGGSNLRSVDFLTRHVGWAVGNGGADATFIFRTSDGGRNWERVPLLDGEGVDFTAVRFADANTGWITGPHHLLRTTDGGENWEPMEWGHDVNGSLWARALLPLGAEALIVGSDGGWVRITEDGGRSWLRTRLYEGRSNETISALALMPRSTLYAVTNGKHLSSSAVYRSSDGRSWEKVIQEDAPLHAIDFHDSKLGVVVGEGVAYSTTDGGTTWKKALVAGTRHAVSFVSPNTVIAAGNGPHIMVSENGGRTWRTGPSMSTYTTLNGLAAVDGGWWFATATFSPGLYHYVDTNYTAPIAEGALAIPASIELPGGKKLPSGMYRVSIAHRGERHILGLRRTGAAPSQGGEASEAVCDPCEAELPVDVEYVVEELDGEAGASPGLRLSLEPTETGLAIVLDAAVKPTRSMAAALAALGVPAPGGPETSTTITTQDAGETAAKAGGLIDRLQKAARGDLRGAAAGAVDPSAAMERAASAKAAPWAIYRIKVRHTLDLVSGGGM